MPQMLKKVSLISWTYFCKVVIAFILQDRRALILQGRRGFNFAK